METKMSITNTGGPAFPTEYRDDATQPCAEGMTLRQYAAIKLKVPDSGTDWLDDMIRKSNEFDMMLLTNQQQSNTL
jgi:hypothetical protein